MSKGNPLQPGGPEWPADMYKEFLEIRVFKIIVTGGPADFVKPYTLTIAVF